MWLAYATAASRRCHLNQTSMRHLYHRCTQHKMSWRFKTCFKTMRQSEFGNINDDCFHMTQVACVAEVTYDDRVHTSFLSGSMQPHVNERDRRVVKKVLSRRAALGETTSPPPPCLLLYFSLSTSES